VAGTTFRPTRSYTNPRDVTLGRMTVSSPTWTKASSGSSAASPQRLADALLAGGLRRWPT
jgi:hypothetical protein